MKNNKKDKYDFGQCKGCNKEAPLKNGYCIKCKDMSDLFNDLPDVFKDIFNPKR